MNEEMRDMERRRRRFLEDQRIYAGAARSEGIAQGKAEGRFEVAQNMKRETSDFDFIARVTGLSRAEIEHLE